MEFNELMKGLAAELGGAVELTPDESGTVMLEIDEMPVSILELNELGLVVLLGIVGDLPPEEKIERLYRALLEANHHFSGTAGATLSVNPETNAVELCRPLERAVLDGERLFGELERFVNTLEVWRKLVTDFRGTVEGAPTAEPTAVETVEPSDLESAGMLRV